MSTEQKTFPEKYAEQQSRCRELIREYESVGPAGAFGIAIIETTLREADHASASGDTVAMLRAYKQMEMLR